MCDAGCDAGPLSSIVWANFLAMQWLVCAICSQLLPEQILSCHFFSYLPTVSFFPVTLFILLPKWTVTFFPVSFFSHLSTVTFFPVTFFSYLSTVTFFPVTFFPTCPLLLSFLLLFFLLLFFLPETVTFFPDTFFPVTFFPCTIKSTHGAYVVVVQLLTFLKLHFIMKWFL